MGDPKLRDDIANHIESLCVSLCDVIDTCSELKSKLHGYSLASDQDKPQTDIWKVKQAIHKLKVHIDDIHHESPKASCSFQEGHLETPCETGCNEPSSPYSDEPNDRQENAVASCDKETQTNGYAEQNLGGSYEIVPGYHKWKSVTFSEHITTEFVCDIKVGMTEDSQSCWISGLSMLNRQTLVIADTDNKAIKLFDLHSYEMKDRLELPFSPWDIAVLPDNQVVATLYHNESIVFLKCSGCMSIDKILALSGNCCGIAYHDNKLVVTFCHPGKIQVMTLKGEVLRSLPTEVMLSRYVTYVAITGDPSYILVSDTTDSSILKLTWDLHVVGRYKSQDQDGVCSLAPSDDGTFYVCSQFTNNVHRITNTMERLETVLKGHHGITEPQALYVNDREKLLFISCGSNQLVKVFSIIG